MGPDYLSSSRASDTANGMAMRAFAGRMVSIFGSVARQRECSPVDTNLAI